MLPERERVWIANSSCQPLVRDSDLLEWTHLLLLRHDKDPLLSPCLRRPLSVGLLEDHSASIVVEVAAEALVLEVVVVIMAFDDERD